jgi:hypothetical protein
LESGNQPEALVVDSAVRRAATAERIGTQLASAVKR